MTDGRDVWVLVLQAEDAEAQDVGRLVARLMKTLGRTHGLKCLAYGGRELLKETGGGCEAAGLGLPGASPRSP